MKICTFPEFRQSSKLTDFVTRAQWYLAPLSDYIDQVSVFVSGQFDIGAIPTYLDQSIEHRSLESAKIELLSHTNDNPEYALDVCDLVLLHDQLAREKLDELLKRRAGKPPIVVRVDENFERFAPSFFLKIHEYLNYDCAAKVSDYQQRFVRLKDEISEDIVYLFGTGPNLDQVKDFDFSDGVCFACNSMVINEELLERLRPKVIFAGDPIFHAGPARYAQKFREKLVAACRKYDAALIVPMRDHHIYEHFLPDDIRQNLIAIPFGTGTRPNLDLTKKFQVTTTANILTLFQVPIAASLGTHVRISGCDGRPKIENQYFWKHNSSVQIVSEMDSIQEAHPAFFTVDYDDYYDTHCDTLSIWLEACEAQQIKVENLTDSYIPALAERHTKDFDQLAVPAVSIVMPCFNASKFVEDAIQSIQQQTESDWELLVVDDGSEDQSREIVGEIARQDSRVKLLENDRGKGVSAARNHGIQNSRGRFIAFLDADDILASGSLASRMSHFQDNPDAMIVHGAVDFIDDAGRELGCGMGARKRVSFDDSINMPAHFNTVMIRCDLKPVCFFPEDMTNGEDWFLFAKLLRLGYHSDFVPGAKASYRVHRNSTVLKDFLKHEKELSRVLDWLFSTAQEADSNPQHRRGLDPDLLPQVQARRATSPIFWSILEGDIATSNRLAVEFMRAGHDKWVHWPDLVPSLVTAGVRFFQVPKDRLGSIGSYNLAKISRTLDIIETKLGADIRMSFSTVFGDNMSKPQSNPEYARTDHAHVDETKVVSRLLSNRTGRSHTLLDVGAHFGTSSSFFDRLGWSIFCFEPDPKNRKKLLARFGESNNVLIDNRAVSDRVATGLQFFSSEESTGISGLLAFRDTHAVAATVDATTVAEVIKEHSIDRIDFLKIDVEGYDLNVLKGVPWDICKPDVIECEFEDNKTLRLGHDWRDIAEYLSERGYAVYVSEWHPIVRYGIPHDWRRIFRYPSEEMSTEAWGNLIAFKEDPGLPSVAAAFEAEMKFRVEKKDAVKPVALKESPPPTAKSTSKEAISPPKPIEQKADPSARSPRRLEQASNQGKRTQAISIDTDTSPSRPTGPWYAEPAHKIRNFSPELFNLFRFLRRSTVHILQRPLLLATIVVSLGLITWVGLDPRWDSVRPLTVAIGFAVFVIGLVVYVAYRAHFHAEQLHLQNAARTEQIALLDRKLAASALKSSTDKLATSIVKLEDRIAKYEAVINEKDQAIAEYDAAIKAQRLVIGEHAKILGDLEVTLGNKVKILTHAIETSCDELELKIQSALNERLDRLGAALEAQSNENQDLVLKLSVLGDEIQGLESTQNATIKELSEHFELEIVRLSNTHHEESVELKSVTKELSEHFELEIARLSDSHSELSGDLESVKLNLTESETAQRDRFSETESLIGSEISSVKEQFEGSLAEVTARLREYKESAISSMEQLSVSLKDSVMKLDAQQDSINGISQEMKSIESSSSANAVSFSEQLNNVSEDLKAAVADIQRNGKWSAFNNSNWYQRFNRKLQDDHIKILETDWRRRLSIPLSKTTIGYMATRACDIELRLEGRLATTVEDILLRSLIAKAVKSPNVNVLEIGTLFGTGAAIMYDAICSSFENIHFTLLDPLEGYYHQAQTDVLTGQIVDEAVVVRNLHRAGMTPENYTLVKHLSTDSEAISAVGSNRYDVLIIDGDHSYAGVKTDFENYAKFVKLGGYIILDDYGASDWPDVKEFADRELSDHEHVTLVGASWRTCVYRVVKEFDRSDYTNE